MTLSQYPTALSLRSHRLKVVIVGGGAGGLELACKLGRSLGSDCVTLVDSKTYHIWKPSLHEVAAGTLDIHQEGLSYSMLAHQNGFNFVLGTLEGLNAAENSVTLSAVVDETGEEILPKRSVSYDRLVISIGSQCNHFGVKGALENTISLDSPQQAETFRLKMLKCLAMLDVRKPEMPDERLNIVIIGAGATGVELAAELREASRAHSRFGFRNIDATHDVSITLLEGSNRILPVLPAKVSAAALELLHSRHINVVSNCKVVDIAPDMVSDASGNTYKADLCVWAAGIKAPALLATLGLPVNSNNQLEVDGTLQVKGHPDIFSIGDCAACRLPDGSWVPPRAQSAHQQAGFLAKRFVRESKGRYTQAIAYRYRDYGSLVSLGRRASVGSLMGNLFMASNVFVKGLIARSIYASLHLKHHYEVLGPLRTFLLATVRFLSKRARPLVKLH